MGLFTFSLVPFFYILPQLTLPVAPPTEHNDDRLSSNLKNRFLTSRLEAKSQIYSLKAAFLSFGLQM